MRLESQGKNAGCWVMSLGESAEIADKDDPDKILVRSNGTVTYTGKDIAYQLWKLGKLTDQDGARHDFGYRTFDHWAVDGPAELVRYGVGDNVLARTTTDRTAIVAGHTYGHGERVYNVIDVRQSYPQKVVKEAVRVLGHAAAADASIHFAYEMVALTPAAVRRIEERTGVSFGLDDETMAKAFVEMSGRRGIGVKADEFLDVLTDAAEEAIVQRLGHAGAPVAQPRSGLRLRRGAGLRGRHRSLPAVLRGAGSQDLRQACRAPRRGTARALRAAGARGRLHPG
jgi:arginyl-tRNA synthetase